MKAVNKCGLVLDYINHEKFNKKVFYKLCITALNNCGCALEFIKRKDINYYNICKCAIKNDTMALEFVNPELLDTNEYYDICIFAIFEKLNEIENIPNINILKYIKKYKLGTLYFNIYEEIIKICIFQNTEQSEKCEDINYFVTENDFIKHILHTYKSYIDNEKIIF